MEKWLSKYLRLMQEKPDMSEVGWRHEMVPLLIGQGLGYPSSNIGFEKERADVIVRDDQRIQHIVIETKLSEKNLGQKSLKQAIQYLKGGESFVVLASPYIWRVFRPGRTPADAAHLGDIRFDEEDGIENDTLFLRLSREMMQDNYRFADFRAGTAVTGYIPIDEMGFKKLVDALQSSVEMLFQYATIVWPRQVERYDFYLGEKRYIDDAIDKVQHSGANIYTIGEEVKHLEREAGKLERKFAVPIEAHRSYEIFRRIQPYSGPADDKKTLDIYLREASHLALNRALMTRILEDKGLLKRKISNGGIKLWHDFTTYLAQRYQALLRFSFTDTENLYHHFFTDSAFDWYLKVNGELGDVVEKVLYLLNSFDFSDVDRDLLSRVYQRFFSPEMRKKLGEFYTPAEVIQYLLRKSGWPGEGRLLDFSCGSGGFLVEALKGLLAEAEKRGLSAEQQWRQTERIVGLDINPFATHISEINMLSLMVNLFKAAVDEKKGRGEDPQLPDLNVFCIDSLDDSTYDPDKSDEKDNGAIDFATWPGERYGDALEFRDEVKYRFVVGNPPYVRNERLDEKSKLRYARIFSDVREGNTDLYAFFIRRAFDWLEDGGRLAVIVSQGLAEARAADKVRRFVEQFQIEEIVPLEWAEVFGAAVNPFLLVVKKSPITPDHKMTLRQGLRNMAQLDDPKAGRFTKVNQADWAALAPDGSWRLEVTAEDIPILNKLKEYPKPFKGEYGITLRSERVLMGEDKSLMRNPVPILDGREIKCWYTIWQRRYLDYIPEEISDPKSPSYFDGPQVVMPTISLTAQAAVLVDGHYFRDTVMKVTSQAGLDHHAICGVINSQLNRYYSATYLRVGIIQKGYSRFYPRVINSFIAPARWPEILSALSAKGELCRRFCLEAENGDIDVINEIESILGSSRLQFADLPDSDFSTLSGDLDLSLASFNKEGALTDGTLFSLKGDADALFFMVHHAQLAGKEVLKRADVESYRLPASKEQLIEVNRLIAAWMERKPTLAGQLRRAEAEIDELIFSATDLTPAEVAIIKRRCTEFPLSELLKTSLPGKPTRYIQARVYKDRYK